MNDRCFRQTGQMRYRKERSINKSINKKINKSINKIIKRTIVEVR